MIPGLMTSAVSLATAWRARGLATPPSPSWSPVSLFDGTSDGSSGTEVGEARNPYDLTKVFTDEDGTQQAALGDPVARIDGLVGNYNLVQPTSAQRPTLDAVTGDLTGDGNNKGFPATVNFNSKVVTLVFIMEQHQSGDSFVAYEANGPDGTEEWWQQNPGLLFNGEAGYIDARQTDGGDHRIERLTIPGSKKRLYFVELDGTTVEGEQQWWANGVERATTLEKDAKAESNTWSTQVISIGCRGASGTSASYGVDGAFVPLIEINRALTAQERDDILTWAADIASLDLSPAATTQPSITGTAETGNSQTIDFGSWIDHDSLSYVLTLDGAQVQSGAATSGGSTTYTPSTTGLLEVTVTATNTHGSEAATAGQLIQEAPIQSNAQIEDFGGYNQSATTVPSISVGDPASPGQMRALLVARPTNTSISVPQGWSKRGTANQSSTIQMDLFTRPVHYNELWEVVEVSTGSNHSVYTAQVVLGNGTDVVDFDEASGGTSGFGTSVTTPTLAGKSTWQTILAAFASKGAITADGLTRDPELPAASGYTRSGFSTSAWATAAVFQHDGSADTAAVTGTMASSQPWASLQAAFLMRDGPAASTPAIPQVFPTQDVAPVTTAPTRTTPLSVTNGSWTNAVSFYDEIDVGGSEVRARRINDGTPEGYWPTQADMGQTATPRIFVENAQGEVWVDAPSVAFDFPEVSTYRNAGIPPQRFSAEDDHSRNVLDHIVSLTGVAVTDPLGTLPAGFSIAQNGVLTKTGELAEATHSVTLRFTNAHESRDITFDLDVSANISVVSSIEDRGKTFNFSEPVVAGRYMDGDSDWWVETSDTATITSITPESYLAPTSDPLTDGVTERQVYGTMQDWEPADFLSYGFDNFPYSGNSGYVSALNVDPGATGSPISLTTPKTLLKSHPRNYSSTGATGRPMLWQIVPLHVVATAPKDDAFPPSAHESEDKASPFRISDLARTEADLPTGIGDSYGVVETCAAVLPRMRYIRNSQDPNTERDQWRQNQGHDNGERGYYGYTASQNDTIAAMALVGPESQAAKRDLFLHCVRLGIDRLEQIKKVGPLVARAGNTSGQAFLAKLAAWATQDTEYLALVDAQGETINLSDDMTAFQVTQADVDVRVLEDKGMHLPHAPGNIGLPAWGQMYYNPDRSKNADYMQGQNLYMSYRIIFDRANAGVYVFSAAIPEMRTNWNNELLHQYWDYYQPRWRYAGGEDLFRAAWELREHFASTTPIARFQPHAVNPPGGTTAGIEGIRMSPRVQVSGADLNLYLRKDWTRDQDEDDGTESYDVRYSTDDGATWTVMTGLGTGAADGDLLGSISNFSAATVYKIQLRKVHPTRGTGSWNHRAWADQGFWDAELRYSNDSGDTWTVDSGTYSGEAAVVKYSDLVNAHQMVQMRGFDPKANSGAGAWTAWSRPQWHENDDDLFWVPASLNDGSDNRCVRYDFEVLTP